MSECLRNRNEMTGWRDRFPTFSVKKINFVCGEQCRKKPFYKIAVSLVEEIHSMGPFHETILLIICGLMAVLPDLAKFRHFPEVYKSLAIFLQFISYLAKF